MLIHRLLKESKYTAMAVFIQVYILINGFTCSPEIVQA